jgi:hypothetical protein
MLATWHVTFHLGRHAEAVQQVTQQSDHHFMATIAAFFAIGAVGFYLFLLFLSVVFTTAVQNDKGVGYFFATIVALFGALMYHTYVFAFVLNWKLFVACFLAYGIAGGVWSVFRWFRYCRHVVLENPYDQAAQYKQEAYTPEQYYASKLKSRDHKSQLTSWIVFWPWSLVWNFTGDFFTGIYESLANVYEKVSQSVIRSAIKNVPTNYSRQTTNPNKE